MNANYCAVCDASVDPSAGHCPRCGSGLTLEVCGPHTGELEPATVPIDFRPGERFADRFIIVEQIGSGGMGVVYKAIDTELDAEVALKVIQPALADRTAFVERFRREVKITRQITHPNIARVHDLGNWNGLLYLSMEWIEGETLHQLLRQAGTLREGRALEIAERIALALEAAHQRGVVHRDLKPANVMIDRRGNVYVLDFGLALEVGSAQPAGGVVGTPLYMAPEQRRGEQADGRTDLYALGRILRDMLTGLRPPGATEPYGTLSPLLAPLVARLVAEEQSQRPADAAEVRREIARLLRDPAISSVHTHGSGFDRRPAVRRFLGAWALVVLVVGALAVAGWILTRPPPPLLADARAFEFYRRGVHYLLEEAETVQSLDQAIGMFHRAEDREPSSALVLARLGEAYWERFRRDGTAASRQEAERALSRAAQLEPGLPELRNARAIGYIIEGKYHAAEQELRAALDARPDFAMAWANLALIHQERREYDAGRQAIDRALRLQPASFRLYQYLGLFLYSFQEFVEGLKYMRHATELKPDSPSAWCNVGAGLLFLQRDAEAIDALERAVAADPGFAVAHDLLGTAYYQVGTLDRALASYRRAAELDPANPVIWGNLGDTLVALDRAPEARAAYAEAAERAADQVRREPLDAAALNELALYCSKAGRADCATAQADRALELQPDNADLILTRAIVAAQFGSAEEALAWLERAVQHGMPLGQIDAVPEFRPFVGDPRYERLRALSR